MKIFILGAAIIASCWGLPLNKLSSVDNVGWTALVNNSSKDSFELVEIDAEEELWKSDRPRKQFVEMASTGQMATVLTLHNVDDDGFELKKIIQPGHTDTNLLLLNSVKGAKGAHDHGYIDNDELAGQLKELRTVRDEDLLMVDRDLMKACEEENDEAACLARVNTHLNSSGRPSLLQLSLSSSAMVGAGVTDTNIFQVNASANVDFNYDENSLGRNDLGGMKMALHLKTIVDVGAALYARYEIHWCKFLFFSFPCGITMHGVGAKAHFLLDNSLEVNGRIETQRTYPLYTKKLRDLYKKKKIYFIKIIPVQVEFTIPVTAGLELTVKVIGETSGTHGVKMRGEWNTICHRAGYCEELSNFFSQEITNSSLTGGVAASVTLEPYVQVALKASLYWGLLWAQVALRASIPLTFTGKIGTLAATKYDPNCQLGLDIQLKLGIYLVLAVGSDVFDSQPFFKKKIPLWQLLLLKVQLCLIQGEKKTVMGFPGSTTDTLNDDGQPEYAFFDCQQCEDAGNTYCQWEGQFNDDGGCLPNPRDAYHSSCGEEVGDVIIAQCGGDLPSSGGVGVGLGVVWPSPKQKRHCLTNWAERDNIMTYSATLAGCEYKCEMSDTCKAISYLPGDEQCVLCDDVAQTNYFHYDPWQFVATPTECASKMPSYYDREWGGLMKDGGFNCNGPCINHNKAYTEFETAWEACSSIPECTRIMKDRYSSPKKYYLRKSNDTKIVSSWSYGYEWIAFTCHSGVIAKPDHKLLPTTFGFLHTGNCSKTNSPKSWGDLVDSCRSCNPEECKARAVANDYKADVFIYDHEANACDIYEYGERINIQKNCDSNGNAKTYQRVHEPKYVSFNCAQCSANAGTTYCQWEGQFNKDGGCLPNSDDGFHQHCGARIGDVPVLTCGAIKENAYCTPDGDAGGDLCREQPTHTACAGKDEDNYLNPDDCDHSCVVSRCHSHPDCAGFTKRKSDGAWKLKSKITGISGEDDSYQCHIFYRGRFFQATKNSNTCPSGSAKITTERDCQTAADALGRPYAGSTNSPTSPSGCLDSRGDGRNVYFNSQPSGSSNAAQEPICTTGYRRAQGEGACAPGGNCWTGFGDTLTKCEARCDEESSCVAISYKNGRCCIHKGENFIIKLNTLNAGYRCYAKPGKLLSSVFNGNEKAEVKTTEMMPKAISTKPRWKIEEEEEEEEPNPELY